MAVPGNASDGKNKGGSSDRASTLGNRHGKRSKRRDAVEERCCEANLDDQRWRVWRISFIVNNHSIKKAPETIVLNRNNKSKLEETAGLTWAPEAARKTEVRAAKARPAARPRCS